MSLKAPEVLKEHLLYEMFLTEPDGTRSNNTGNLAVKTTYFPPQGGDVSVPLEDVPVLLLLVPSGSIQNIRIPSLPD